MDSITTMVSFDTSSTDTGFAIWKNGKLVRLSHLDLTNYNGSNRTNEMIKEIITLLINSSPDIVVVEGLTVFNDFKTDSDLAEIIGAIRGHCVYNDIFFDRLFPNEWRGLIADPEEKIPRKRIDCKPWDIKKAQALFMFPSLNNDNVADAGLIGQAYINLWNSEDAEEVT